MRCLLVSAPSISQRKCSVCWYITDSRASRSRNSRICSRRRVDSTRASTATSGEEQEVQVSETVISNTHVQTSFLSVVFRSKTSRQSKSCFVTTSLRPHPRSDGPRVRPGYIYIITTHDASFVLSPVFLFFDSHALNNLKGWPVIPLSCQHCRPRPCAALWYQLRDARR